MRFMFNGCNELESLDLSMFNTSKVTEMQYMFNLCEKLKSLNVSHFDTYKVTTMEAMFSSCEALLSLDLSSFTMTGITKTNNMFNRTYSLRTITLGVGFVFREGGYLSDQYQWKDQSTGRIYTAQSVPSGLAATFVRTNEPATGVEATLSVNPMELTFSLDDAGVSTPASQTVTATYANCTLDTPPSNQYVDLKPDFVQSGNGKSVYVVTPKTSVTEKTTTTITFTAARSENTTADPKPVDLTITLVPAEKEKPKATLAIDPQSLEFAQKAWGEFEPASAQIKVTTKGCALDAVDNEYVSLRRGSQVSYNGQTDTTYYVAPKTGVEKDTTTKVTFTAKSSDSAYADPDPVSLTITLKGVSEKPVARKGITYGIDTYAFENSTPYFTDYPRQPITLTGDYRDLLFAGLTSSEISHLKSNFASEWRGSCFGMSSTLLLFKSGVMDESFFQSSASKAHDFIQPNKNETVRNMINYYQMLQSVGELSAARGRYNRTNEAPNNEALIHALDASVYPILIGIEIRDYGAYAGGHALLAYDYTKGADGYDVKVWDPNHMYRPVNLHISADYSDSHFTDNYEWESDGYSTFLKYSIPVEGTLTTFKNLQQGLTEMGLRSATAQAIRAVGQQLTLNTNYDSFTITSSSGKTATIAKGEKTAGDLDVGAADYLNEPNREFDIDFTLPALASGESYTVTPMGAAPKTGFNTTLLDRTEGSGYCGIVTTDAIGSFTIASDGTVTSDLNSGAGSQTVSVTSNATKASWETVSVKGSADRITVTPATSSSSAITTDSQTTLSVTASNLYNDATLSATGKTFTVSEPAAGKVQLASETETKATTLGHSAVFYTGGGTAIETQTNIQPGAKVKKPADPKRYGYTFDGWYTSPDYKTPYDFNSAVTSDLKLYAKWTEGAATTPSVTIYRLYNEHADTGIHHYTTQETEYNNLPKVGWTQEGVGWYGLKQPA